MTARSSRRVQIGATLGDVARRAGVSPMTVSRVINSSGNVHPNTRERVSAAIEALSYTPNSAARSLAGGTLTRLALLYSNPSAAYLSEFLVGSLAKASKSDVQMIVEKCDEADEVAVVRRLIERGIDGVVLPPPLCDSRPVLEALFEANVPTVVVASGAPADQAFAVSIDDEEAARQIAHRLLALGHRRIGFIIGNRNQTASAKRLAGYCRALKEAGEPRRDALIEQGDFSYRSGLEAADRLLGGDAPPTAIFASNDDMAAAAVAVAHRRGLDVPGDVAVCGFDDTALATTIWPELTTVHQPIADMAGTAVELLLIALRRTRAGDPVQPEKRILDFSVIHRGSDGPVKSTAQA
jgi:LacI family transcriptional regulator